MLSLHLTQLLIISQIFLIVLPISLIVVLPSKLLTIYTQQRPTPYIAQSALLQHIQIWVLDRDIFRFQSGNDRIGKWSLVQCLNSAKDSSLSHSFYQKVYRKSFAVCCWLTHQIFEQLLAIFVSFLRADLNLSPDRSFGYQFHLLLNRQFPLSYYVHMVRDKILFYEYFTRPQNIQFGFKANFIKLLKGKLAKEWYGQKFVANVSLGICLISLFCFFDPNIMYLQQFDTIYCLELSLPLIEIENQTIPNIYVDEPLFVYRVYLLLNFTFAQYNQQGVRFDDFSQIGCDY